VRRLAGKLPHSKFMSHKCDNFLDRLHLPAIDSPDKRLSYH
jgi:hypothetical protein